MTFRAIDVSHLPAVPTPDLAMPSLHWIKITDLVIDDRYQRPLGRANWAAIQKIAATFDWAKFSAVLVAPIAGGAFAVIDGQHRVHAALLCGFDQVPCLCVLVTAEQQARAFVGVNTSQIRIGPHQIYRAALAAREDWALACLAAVAAAGCALATTHPSAKDKKPRVVYAVNLIRKAVAAGQGQAVTAALAAFDVRDRVALYSDYILAPWIAAVAAHPAHSRADLVAVLRVVDPYKVVDRACALPGKGSNAQKASRLFQSMIADQIKAVAA